MKQPKVSIIVPVYNSEKHLDECIYSIVNQTLKDIEIICVDDGSTDSSNAMLQEWQKKDPRIKVVRLENSGTGHAINTGIIFARGEYIGEVDADDFIEADMYETLYELANHKADIVKGGYYGYLGEKEIPANLVSIKTEFCPTELDFMDRLKVFGFQCSFWSGIYRTEFIKENQLYWRETPGASFQDTSAIFKTMAKAKHMVWTEKNFYHWRCNEAHTVTSTKHPFAVVGEYREIERFLTMYPDKEAKLRRILSAMRFGTFCWNLGRIAQDDKKEFIEMASNEFKRDWEFQDARFYAEDKWELLKLWTYHPEEIAKLFEEDKK